MALKELSPCRQARGSSHRGGACWPRAAPWAGGCGSPGCFSSLGLGKDLLLFWAWGVWEAGISPHLPPPPVRTAPPSTPQGGLTSGISSFVLCAPPSQVPGERSMGSARMVICPAGKRAVHLLPVFCSDQESGIGRHACIQLPGPHAAPRPPPRHLGFQEVGPPGVPGSPVSPPRLCPLPLRWPPLPVQQTRGTHGLGAPAGDRAQARRAEQGPRECGVPGGPTSGVVTSRPWTNPGLLSAPRPSGQLLCPQGSASGLWRPLAWGTWRPFRDPLGQMLTGTAQTSRVDQARGGQDPPAWLGPLPQAGSAAAEQGLPGTKSRSRDWQGRRAGPG